MIILEVVGRVGVVVNARVVEGQRAVVAPALDKDRELSSNNRHGRDGGDRRHSMRLRKTNAVCMQITYAAVVGAKVGGELVEVGHGRPAWSATHPRLC